MPTEAQAQARPTRAAALLLAAAAAIWGIRLAEAAIALVVAALSGSRRSGAQLRGLTFVLTLNIHVASIAVAVLMPSRAEEAAAISSAVVLGAALFAPWSWRWQALLAGVIVVTGEATQLYVRGAGGPPAGTLQVDAILLVTAAAASVLGAHFAHRERLRVAASETRYRGLFESASDG